MIRLNYHRRTTHESGVGRKEREYMLGSATVNGVTFTDAWLIRTGKNGVLKRYATNASGIILLNPDRTAPVTEIHRGRVKVRRAS